MRGKSFFAKVFAVLAVCTAAAAILMSAVFLNATPVVLNRPQAAQEQVRSMLDCVSAGDYNGAGQLMYGTPSFGPERQAAEEVSVLLWEEFSDSISYELVGECYAVDTGLAQNVRITCLDFASVTQNLKPRFQVLLEQRIAQAEDVSELYDEQNNYREDMVMELLKTATEDSIREDAAMVTREVTVKLIYDQGQWWILPDDALLDVITGGILN